MMATYAQERAEKLRRMYAVPGRRKARLSYQGIRILAMLGPWPWEGRAGTFTVIGQNVSWDPSYDEVILAQSGAPGFPAKDRARILAAYGEHRTRSRKLLGRTASSSARRRGAR